ncbi:MAG TPA: DUF1553 domain-containing protein [Planctomycetes bacterium]|nr:DUF1553 domain-containing protein [Planctomycetota bacterium]
MSHSRLFRHALVGLTVLAGSASSLLHAEREWPFNPLTETAPPEVHSKWVRNSIDAFVLKRLNEAGLEPAVEAARRQLVRRLYFDLIGLPPSPEDVETFLDDKSERAYEDLVERLLKDPRYGERWARLWLDLARYADTAGYEGDPDMPHAWRYRDYVIDAFNNDKPYTQFIKEQIAGDEFAEVMGAGDLPGTPSERVVAMTFLRLAPFTEPRGDETRHELLSEMTSTVGSVFLGLTVGCAKCHDHKHDDIPTRDFYRLKAFFSTVSIPRPEPGDGFQIGGSIASPFYRKDEQKWANERRIQFEREIVESKEELQQLSKSLTEKLGGNAGFGVQAMGGSLGNNYIYGRTSVNQGDLHTSTTNCDGKQWTFFTDNRAEQRTGSNAGTNQGQWYGDLPNPEHISLGQYSEGTGKIKTAGAHHVGEFSQVLIYDHPLSEAERVAIASWLKAKVKGSTGSSTKSAEPPGEGLRFWLDAADLDANPRSANPDSGNRVARWTDRVGGITLSQHDPDRQPSLAVVKTNGEGAGATDVIGVRFEDDFLTGPIGDAAFAQDQTGSLVVVYTARHSHEGYGFEVGGKGVFLSTFINPAASSRESLDSVLADADNDLVSSEQRQRYRWLADRERFLRQQIKRLQPVSMSLRHSYGPPYEPGVPTSTVMIRGEYDNPGEVVTAGFLTCITGADEPAKIRLDPFKRWPTRSRRMALAQWIASPDNPLTARVAANRLWHWHFGRGIVATPSDFGQLSGGPSHPQLLDWLANQFIQQKWSIKALHRLIVTSATYRQTSLHYDKRADQLDPDNKLLWRFRRRRLEAEAVRDSVLTASGRLNSERFGLPIFPPLPGGIEERVKFSTSKWDTQRGPEGRKRSIYIYQQRTLTMPFMQSFDALVCDESRPRRRYSVTPLQALAMYNGGFVNDEAKHFAGRVRNETPNDVAKQIHLAFQIALSRPPTSGEVAELESFANSDESGMVGVCRILLNCNEFIYVD